jgi:cytosine/adenosine deaminase-related metal-dependent hydrolase
MIRNQSSLSIQSVTTVYNEHIAALMISKGKIASAETGNNKTSHTGKQLVLHFNDALVLPGLINSHDHLDFDLFPQLGNRKYADYIEWGKDIHAVNKKEISNVLQVPRHLRVQWGIYKNMIAGVTTVVHHGQHLHVNNPPINVYQRCNMLHSVQLEKKLALKLNNPFAKSWPFVIHIGEGTNEQSHDEIDTLIRINYFKKKLIGVHGIALNTRQAKHFEALIWCPGSNFFLQGITADVQHLKEHTNILFGTDSTVSASWNIWQQLRLAKATNMLNDAHLFNTVTTTAASVWKLNAGVINKGFDADIIVVEKRNNEDNIATFYASDPGNILLVLKSGNIVLFDELLLVQFTTQKIDTSSYQKIYVAERTKYISGDIRSLLQNIRSYMQDASFPIETD